MIEAFRRWLMDSYGLQARSAGDVISRRNKLLTIVADPTEMTMDQLRQTLNIQFTNGSFTQNTLRGMLRSEKLFREFNRLMQ